jgi:tRNA threonylcarbamoyl adenosine modification protein YeaZ
MKILALEFSSSRRSVAILEYAAGAATVLAHKTTSQAAGCTGLSLIDEALSCAGIGPREIGMIALGLGPGSYTGIRSSIAIAQGWKLAHDVILRGISSADVLARQAARIGKTGALSIIIDAQRGEFYRADYALEAGHPHGFRQTAPLAIVPASSLDPELATVGPDIKQVAFCTELFPDAISLGELALKHEEQNDCPESLEPIYLRPIAFVKAASAKTKAG